jgi:hypothetical protein
MPIPWNASRRAGAAGVGGEAAFGFDASSPVHLGATVLRFTCSARAKPWINGRGSFDSFVAQCRHTRC